MRIKRSRVIGDKKVSELVILSVSLVFRSVLASNFLSATSFRSGEERGTLACGGTIIRIEVLFVTSC